jgi:hypothetical protein
MPWSPAYVSVAELKSYLRIGDIDDDDELGIAAETASRAVDHAANRQFGSEAGQARSYTARYDRWSRRWVVDIDDTFDDTLTVDSDGDAITGFILLPRNAPVNGRPFERIAFSSSVARDEGAITVTADFGWPAVPDAITQATLLQASRFFVRRVSPYGIAGSPETGSEMRLLDRVDPDVAVALRPFRRIWGAV